MNVLRDTKVKTILNDIIGTVNESKRKPNKLWVVQGRKFNNNLIKNNLDTNDILMQSTHNKGKSLVVGRFIRTL